MSINVEITPPVQINAEVISQNIINASITQPPAINVTLSTSNTVAWGNIVGILSNQLDLQNALDLKADKSIAITGAGLLAGQGGDLSANRIFTLNNSDIDHNSITNTHNLTSDISHLAISDVGSNTHAQIDTHISNSNIHIDWTNASDNFLTSGTLGCGDATINGKVLIDDTDTEALFVRKDSDSGDVFQVDTTNDHIYFGARDNIVDMSWRLEWAPGGDTTTGVFFSKQWKKVTYNACAWEYKADFYGFSNNLVAVNPGGFSFYSRYNDAKSAYNNVTLTFQSHDITDTLIGNYYIRSVENGDWEFGYNYSNLIFKIDYTTRNLQFSEGINIILGTATGTKIGTAVGQKLGFWNATPIVQPTITGAKGGNVALTNLLTALANIGLLVDNTT